MRDDILRMAKDRQQQQQQQQQQQVILLQEGADLA
jgi:hypothetical protein